MITVMIAEDHAVVRRGLRHIVEDDADIRVGGEAANADELMALLETHGWDVIVMDLSMPGASGLELIKEVKRRSPDVPLLVLTMPEEIRMGIRTLRAGASGFLVKEGAPSELAKAVRKVAAGEQYISEGLTEQLAHDAQWPQDGPLHQRLSDREMEVLRMLASGLTVSETANRLVLSVKTVSTYRTRVLEKLKLRTTAELIRYAVEQRLVE